MARDDQLVFHLLQNRRQGQQQIFKIGPHLRLAHFEHRLFIVVVNADPYSLRHGVQLYVFTHTRLVDDPLDLPRQHFQLHLSGELAWDNGIQFGPIPALGCHLPSGT